MIFRKKKTAFSFSLLSFPASSEFCVFSVSCSQVIESSVFSGEFVRSQKSMLRHWKILTYILESQKGNAAALENCTEI